MIYLELFWTYFKIGLFTIGGGYAMIPLIKQEIVGHLFVNGMVISEEIFLDMLVLSESMPGPISIDFAVFVGMQLGSGMGVLNSYLLAITASIAVTLPSFLIMMLICTILTKIQDTKPVKGALAMAQPVVLGLIAAAAASVLFSVILPGLDTSDIKGSSVKTFDYISLILFAAFLGLSYIKIKGKRISPIIIILIAAAVGIVLYGLIGIG